MGEMEAVQAGRRRQKRSERSTLGFGAVPSIIDGKVERTDNNSSGGGRDGDGGESEHEMHIWTERERRKKMRTMFSSLHALLPHLPPKADKSSIVDEAVKYINTLQHTLQSLQEQRLQKLQLGGGGGGGGGSTSINNVEHEIPASVITSQTDEDHHQPFESSSFMADDDQRGVMNFIIPAVPKNYKAFPDDPACSLLQFKTWFSPNVVMNMCGDDAQFCICSPTSRNTNRMQPGLLTTILYILEKNHLDVVSAHVHSAPDHYHTTYMIHAHVGGAFDQNRYPEALSVEDTFKLAAGEMNLWLLSC